MRPDLFKRITEMTNEIDRCTKCGMCIAVCPLYRKTGRESDVARGKLALLEKFHEDLFDSPKGVGQRIDKCLLCGACQSICPRGIQTVAIFLAARTILTEFQGGSLASKLIVRTLLGHPPLFHRAMNICSRGQSLFLPPPRSGLQAVKPKYASHLLNDRHFTPLAQVTFHQTHPFYATASQTSSTKVALFVGCLVDKFYPRLARMLIALLEHHHMSVIVPAGQGCCGMPGMSLGDLKTTLRLIQYHGELFDREDISHIVSLCPTCAYAIKKIWPLALSLGRAPAPIKQKIKTISEKTIDIHSLLLNRYEKNFKSPTASHSGARIRVTYHDACHLKRSLGISQAPRALIRANPHYELIEMAQPDACCGMGGGFNLKYYQTSLLISESKKKDILHTHCREVVTGCPACMLQLADVLARSNVRLGIRHPLEIYAENFSIRLPD